MTDNKNTVPESTNQDNDIGKDTVEKSNTVTRSQAPKTDAQKTSARSLKKDNSSKAPEPVKSSTSKTGAIALLLSLVAIAGIGGHYYWQTQQHQNLIAKLRQQNQTLLNNNESQLLQKVSKQQDSLAGDITDNVRTLLNDSEQQLQALQQQVKSLGQNQASDWLIHEAEYLIRVASRSLWLEKDTTAAIGLLQDADARLAELNDPTLLSVRQLINQDIEQLRLQPKLETESTILTLMAMAEQIKQLPIAMAYLPDATDTTTTLELSENTDDWRENLAKSWQRFLNDFITVRRRTANVEALLSPKQQQNLRDNLHLKLQLAQWAASQHKPQVYQQALTDAQSWVNEYFDTDRTTVTLFSEQLMTLNSAVIQLNLPAQLNSFKAIRTALNNTNNASQGNTSTAPLEAVIAQPELEEKEATPNDGANL